MSDLIERANKGEADAMFAVGLLYELGLDRPVDLKMAFAWMQKAAQIGDARAMAKVAESYALGRGVERNDELASKWSEKAQTKGFEGGKDFARKRRATRTGNAGKKALVVSSDEATYSFLTGHLESVGFSTEHVDHPGQASTVYDEMGDPTFAFVDLLLPGVSGFNVVTTLKAKVSKKKPTFIVIADVVTKDDVVAGRTVGVDNWLIKPVTKFSINKILTRY